MIRAIIHVHRVWDGEKSVVIDRKLEWLDEPIPEDGWTDYLARTSKGHMTSMLFSSKSELLVRITDLEMALFQLLTTCSCGGRGWIVCDCNRPCPDYDRFNAETDEVNETPVCDYGEHPGRNPCRRVPCSFCTPFRKVLEG